MKKICVLFATALLLSSCANLNQLGNGLNAVNSQNTGNTTNTAIKDLLLQSALSGIGNLGTRNGFLNNSLYKILLPPEAQKIAGTLQMLGLGSLVNNVETQVNHSAEQAVVLAKPIFTNAVKNMSITDAAGLIAGGDNSITNFFKQKTSNQLIAAFMPVIKASLDKNDATKYYNQLATTYNSVPLVKNKLNPDLTNYVANQAMNAMFSQMATAEKNIRHNPAQQTTAALKQIFGNK
ncbi:DUF4197 domain-containing protein [Arachidicoccus sp.]|jgi:hypothetical protein|uniref:DUF4197 domain-containing protein n=1 Tax=Arachidicoccus sp. TaxID=1872624 RepID=UPI003D255133